MPRVQVSFRTTDERRAEIKRLAKLAGVSIGDYLEKLVGGQASDNADEERNRRAIRSALKWVARAKTVDGPFWHRVMHVLGVGSIDAERICFDNGFDVNTGLERGDG